MHQNVQTEIRSILDKMIVASHDNPEVERLTWQLETLTSAYILPTIDCPWQQGYGMEPQESRVARLLHSKLDRVVTREALLNALFFDRSGEEPHPKIIDVYVCRMRKRLANSEYAIETSHGQGFKMVMRHKHKQAA